MVRTGVVVLLLLWMMGMSGCATLVATGGASSTPADDGRSAAEMRHDADITNRLNAAFVRDPLVTATDIHVHTYKGTVTLRGHVAGRRVAERAVALARGIPGVRRVLIHLTY